MTLRLVRVEDEGPRLRTGLAQTIAKGVADNFRHLVYEDKELFASLSNTLILHEEDVRQASTLLGRFIGLFSAGPNPDHVKVDGMRLRQLLELAQITPPVEIVISGAYEIDLPSLRNALSIATRASCSPAEDEGSG